MGIVEVPFGSDGPCGRALGAGCPAAVGCRVSLVGWLVKGWVLGGVRQAQRHRRRRCGGGHRAPLTRREPSGALHSQRNRPERTTDLDFSPAPRRNCPAALGRLADRLNVSVAGRLVNVPADPPTGPALRGGRVARRAPVAVRLLIVTLVVFRRDPCRESVLAGPRLPSQDRTSSYRWMKRPPRSRHPHGSRASQ